MSIILATVNIWSDNGWWDANNAFGGTFLIGLYVHVPFCVRKCAYCDFYSVPAQAGFIESYIDAVLTECGAYGGMPFRTLFLGGGTPSILGADTLKRLVDGLRSTFDLSQLEESTIEANPESATKETLEAALESGFSRISIGVQSLSDGELETVGRIHTAGQSVAAIVLAKRIGFRDISADLIIGLPGQSWDSLQDSIEKLVAMGVSHLSLYCLSLEHGTSLAQNPPGNLPSDDVQAELFEQAREFLKNKGFVHYEISNFAVSGRECLHNLNYWRGGEYLGLGPSAASHLGGKRFKNRADLEAYLENPIGVVEDVEELGAEEKAAEEAMLRLRLLEEGLGVAEFTRRHGQKNVRRLLARLDMLSREGLLLFDGLKYRLEPSLVLTSNPILARVLQG
jgi:oxygen-independent coproporphyrinogen-3 oxidase